MKQIKDRMPYNIILFYLFIIHNNGRNYVDGRRSEKLIRDFFILLYFNFNI